MSSVIDIHDIHDNIVTDGSIGINIGSVNASLSPADESILSELRDAQRKLTEQEPMIADAIAELREAIEEQNKSTIRKKIAALTKGTAATIIGPTLCAALKSYIGLP